MAQFGTPEALPKHRIYKMIKVSAKVEVVVNNRIYTLICDNDAPVSDFKEALFQFQKIAASVEDAARDAQDKEVKEGNKEEIKKE